MIICLPFYPEFSIDMQPTIHFNIGKSEIYICITGYNIRSGCIINFTLKNFIFINKKNIITMIITKTET